MKRFMLMTLVAVFVLGNYGTAMAETEFSAKGTMQFLFEWADNTNFYDGDTDGNSEDDFVAAQRTRLFLTAAASENVKAVIGFEIDTDWGFNGGADLGGDEVNVETKRAMLTYTCPLTDLTVSIGLQGFALPGAVAGSPILDDDMAALAMSYQFTDAVAATAFWARIMDDNWPDDGGQSQDDEADLYGVIVPITLDGATVTPWLALGHVGGDTGLSNYDDLDGGWGGVALEVNAFDPLFFKADAMYGYLDVDGAEGDQKGWFVDAALGYKMDMVTPQVVFAYSSGQDADSEDWTWMATPDGSYGLTSFGTDGSATAINRGSSCLLTSDGVATGMMIVGLVLDDISFVDNMTHTFRAVYYTGTSDDDAAVPFDEDDSAVEINFDTNYQIYENLSAIVELGYIALDDDDVSDETDAAKLAVGLKYSF